MAAPNLRQFVLLTLLLFLPAALPAQFSTTLDAGAVRVRYAGSEASSVLSITPAATFEHMRGVVMGAATLSRFEGGGNAALAVLAGSFFAGSWSDVHLSLGAAAEGGYYGADVNTGSVLGDLRAHWVRDAYGAWSAASHGLANDAVVTRNVTRVEVGGWLRRGAVTAAGWVTPSAVEGGIRFTDFTGALRWVDGALELGATVGARSGFGSGSPWGSATASYWVTPHVAIVGGGGSYAADPAQALPAGEYLTLSIRLASRPTPRRVEARRPTPVTPPPVARPVVAGFEMTPARGDERLIVIVARGARTVELMGDFTDWTPVALSPAGADRWRTTLRIPRGMHRFNVRVDGGAWGVPPGVTALQNEFSGVVAVLYVE